MDSNIDTMLDTQRYDYVNVRTYLKILKRYKWYFHKYLNVNHIYGPYVVELQREGLHFLYAYASLATISSFDVPIGDADGTLKSIKLTKRDKMILGQNIVLVYNADKGFFQVCHKLEDNSLMALNEYIAMTETGIDYHAINPKSTIKLDYRNPVSLHIVCMRNDLQTKVGSDIIIDRLHTPNIWITDIISIINRVKTMRDNYFRKQLKKELKKELAKKEEVSNEEAN